MSDTIVVGAGSAGAIVATRLAERGERVVLLEAGPDFPGEVPPLLTTDLRIPVTEYDWGYESEGDRIIPLPRGKVVGGSSAVNAVAAIRAQPADLDSWGSPLWTYDACLPAMKRLEDDAEFGDEPWHGRGGPIRIERPDMERSAVATRAAYEACIAAGYKECPDENSPGATGAGPQPFNASAGERQSTLVTYLRRARTLPSFSLRPETAVDRLILRNGRAVGVRLIGGEELFAERIVVSAGAYGSPLILMRSGIGPAAHLREHGIEVMADLPVGESFHDHPALPGVLAIARDPAMLDSDLLRRFLIRLSFDGRDGAEDVHLFGPFTETAVRTPFPPGGFVITGFAAAPRSRGWVKLRSADPAASPRVRLGFFEDPADMEPMVKLTAAIQEIFRTQPLAGIIEQVIFPAPDMAEAELREIIKLGALTDHHPSSTCPIGPVVDEHLRVHGIEGLYVCDASVLPSCPRANTNLPTMMTAERFIELL